MGMGYLDSLVFQGFESFPSIKYLLQSRKSTSTYVKSRALSSLRISTASIKGFKNLFIE
jgi:hypothetical protein